MINLLGVEEIVRVHDAVLLETGVGLPGVARDKDLEGMVARVENRIQYELTDDVLYVAAFYAVAISMGHCFNDANKRTGFSAMEVFLRMNGLTIQMEEDAIVEMMRAAAQGRTSHEALAEQIADHLFERVVAQAPSMNKEVEGQEPDQP